MFKVPPYLALLCMLGGIIWICLLPLDEYSRRTYVSENALLPGQVHTYFSGSEQNIFRAYRHEVADVLEPSEQKDDQGQPTGAWLIATDSHRTDRLEAVFKGAGIKTGRQSYSYQNAGKSYQGENIYGIVHGPRADGTESIVLVASIRNIEDQLNVNGVTLLLTLARYFSRWSLWSKDIILVITPDSVAGPQAWVDAYHSMHDPHHVTDLTLKSGHIQGVVCIDYPFNHHFETLHISYDGVNGQLPNLDLINTLVAIASGQMGIGTTIQHQHEFTGPADQGKYLVRLKTLFRGMKSQALGHATGAHSVFMPYHIDAITLTAIGEGWQDEMAFGRTVESMTRSLNNLLEKLHQSFFFYLLLQNTRFVSIGTYLPSAMAIGAGFTIVALFAWVRSGYDELEIRDQPTKRGESSPKQQQISANGADMSKTAPVKSDTSDLSSLGWKQIDRIMTPPMTFIVIIHLISLGQISLLTKHYFESLALNISLACVLVLGLPVGISTTILHRSPRGTNNFVAAGSQQAQFFTILSSISLLLLGLNLTVLATLNFSLSMFLGLICAPLAFVGYSPPPTLPSLMGTVRNAVSALIMILFSPPVVISGLLALDAFYLKSRSSQHDQWYATLEKYVKNESFAFNVCGAWGVMVGIWAVWVPAWVVGATGVLASFGPSIPSRPRANKSNKGKPNGGQHVAKDGKVTKQ